jgi:hypothetical protein
MARKDWRQQLATAHVIERVEQPLASLLVASSWVLVGEDHHVVVGSQLLVQSEAWAAEAVEVALA